MLNRINFSIAGLTLWFVVVITSGSMVLFSTFDGCSSSSVSVLCQNFYSFFIVIYIFALVLLGVVVFKTKEWERPAVLTGVFCGLIYWAQSFALQEISDFRTYGYEVFIVSFYAWVALITTLMLCAFCYPKDYKFYIKISALISLLMVGVFAISGRGSLEHLMPLIGGFYAEYSWEAAKVGKLIYILPFIIGFGVAFSIIYFLYSWILQKDGIIQRLVSSAKIVLAYIVIFSLSLISVPIGGYLNQNDVADAKEYIVSLIDKVEEYNKEKKEYPHHILQVISENAQPPFLLKRYDYLAENTKGGYYLSKPDKYCFLFQEPGKKFGYHSITSDREWRFSHEGQKLSEQYLAVCDESDDILSGESLVAGHLGLDKPGDTIAQMSLELEGNARQPAITQGATKLLEDRIAEIGAKDPSIYSEERIEPGGARDGVLVKNTQELKRALLNGPLDTPEGY